MSILTSSNPVPIIYVSHLPSASSFYAALTQPLGIQFLSAAQVQPACLNYGYISQTSSGPRKTVVFSVTQTRDREPKLVHLSLTAPSEKAVRDFHAKSWVLNKELSSGENILEREGDVVLKAETRDFDGNMLEAIFDSRRTRGERRSSGSGREVEAEPKEAKRVLEWQEEVARSVAHTERSSSRGDGDGGSRAPYHTIKRADSYPLPTRAQVVKRETITTSHYRVEPPIKKPAETESGLSGTAVFGTLLGAAALAGVAYALRRSSSPEIIPARRASEGSRAAYTHAPQGVTDRMPARSYVSEREKDRDGERCERASPRYVQYTIASVPTATSRVHELKRIDERSHHSSVHEVPRSERGGIEMVDHEIFIERPRTILPEPSPDRSSPREREIERERETDRESHVSRRSHRSHRSHKSGSDGSPRSHGSHSGREREREREKEKLYHVEEEAERESSYTSARSHHTHHTARSSTSTVKPIPPLPTVPVPPPAASMVSTSTVRKVRRDHGRDRDRGHREEKDGSSSSGREKEHSGRRRRRESHSHSHHEPPPQEPVYQPTGSHTGSDRSRARHVPLPESVAGASDWERGSVRLVSGLGREYNEYVADRGGLASLEGLREDTGYGGYAASVAPSDSISSVGIKRERESRLRERMRGAGGYGMERERGRGVVGGGGW